MMLLKIAREYDGNGPERRLAADLQTCSVLVTVALYRDPLRGPLLSGTCLSLTSAE